MECSKVVIKAKYNGDIRRMSVDNNLNYRDLKRLIKRLYKIPYFKIFYFDNEADMISIATDMDVANAINSVNETNKVLRLSVEACEQPVIVPSSNTNNFVLTPEVEKWLTSADGRSKLENIVIETVSSKPVMDKIIASLLPFLIPPPPQEIPSDITVPDLYSSQLQRPLVPSEEPSLGFSRVTNDTITELATSISVSQAPAPEPLIQFDDQSTEKKEQYTLEDEDEDDEKSECQEFEIGTSSPNISTSPFKNLLQLVKNVVSKKIDKNEEPNLEEMLKQLNDMGFADRESNIKTLKFHLQFKGGIDDVVEDLLHRSQTAPSAESKEEPEVETPDE